MLSLQQNTAGPTREAVLIAAAVVISLIVLACIPLLLDQTSPARPKALSRTACNIPLVPEQVMDERLFEKEMLPEPSQPPEPEINIPPVDLPDIAPPDIQPPVPECPDMMAAAPSPMPAVLPHIDLPAQTPLSLKGLAVRPAPGRLAMNIKPGKFRLPVTAPGSGHRFNLEEVDHQPKSISTMQPLYPYQARRMAIEGYVTVRFLVSHTGAVDELTILKAEPEGVFEETVTSTVRRWRFKPAQKNGQPVATWIKTSIEFKLQDAS